MSASGWASGFVTANGIAMHWTRTGAPTGERPTDGHASVGRRRPALVLAHGFSDDGLCWTPIAADLEPDYDVVMLDARGHGLSDAPERGYGPIAMGEDIVAAAAALGLEAPVAIGHSMGAIAALVGAGLHPEAFRAIILEDPPCGWLERQPGGTDLTDRIERLRAEIDARRRRDRSELIEECRAESPSWPNSELGPWADAKIRLRPAAASAVDAQERMSVDWPEIIGAVACPVLVIAADPALGSALSPQGERLLAERVPRARIVRISGAGHSVRREAREAYLGLVRAFVSGV